jgi:peptidoglycan/xylan/chitin deacetylase (PgdA/CDA1 family)
MTELTIVMYHYVRPLQRTRFPGIKGLDVALFDEQLEYLVRNYSVVSMEAVLDALDGRAELPPHPVLLTFDDGYLDHYTYVFPRLATRGIAGAFFPPAVSALERKVLDVNKIHFVLAGTTDVDALVTYVEKACAAQDIAALREKYWKPGAYDSAPVNYVKRMLQVALPEALRTKLAAELFARYVSADESAFAEELYATLEQLRHMVAAGMHVGSHGSTHRWFGSLTASEQEKDIDDSLHLLRAVGAPPDRYTMCYPYGDFNECTVEIVAARGFKAAVTTRVALADVSPGQRFALPRLDTNDLPKSRDAARDRWMRAHSASAESASR